MTVDGTKVRMRFILVAGVLAVVAATEFSVLHLAVDLIRFWTIFIHLVDNESNAGDDRTFRFSYLFGLKLEKFLR